MYENLKEQLCLKYPFLRETGKVNYNFDAREVFQKYENEKLLVLMASVQGAGKTTYCKENFSKYWVVNFDEILEKYLENRTTAFSEKDNERVNRIALKRITKGLEEKEIAIVDFAGNDLTARVCMLHFLQGKYTKVILLVLNPSFEKIKAQIQGEIAKRFRPDLFEDILKEYQFLQIQKEEHFFEMGMDEVYYI